MDSRVPGHSLFLANTSTADFKTKTKINQDIPKVDDIAADISPLSFSPRKQTIQTITRWFLRILKCGSICNSDTSALTTRWLTIYLKNFVIFDL